MELSGRFEFILDNISEAVLVADSSLKLLWTNRQAKTLFTENLNISLLEATRLIELEAAANKVLAEKKPHEFELKMYRNRRQYIFHAMIIPVKAAETIIILEDRSKLYRLEQIKRDFAANVSHELRTPIQLIMGFTETILEYDLPKDKLKRSLEIIQKNAKTMENLTNDLLTLVSIEDEENPRPEMTETNIHELVTEAVQSVNPGAQKKKIKIKESCMPGLMAKVCGSFVVIALVNLLDNAIKYSPPSSKINIRAVININFLTDGKKTLEIRVRDKGIGIPGEFQERIFERFFRVDKARSRDAGGTGLGLAIVRHIALLHNGRVEVESHAGEGSCFTLIIPQ